MGEGRSTKNYPASSVRGAGRSFCHSLRDDLKQVDHAVIQGVGQHLPL